MESGSLRKLLPFRSKTHFHEKSMTGTKRHSSLVKNGSCSQDSPPGSDCFSDTIPLCRSVILSDRAFYVTGISCYIKRPLQSSMYLCSDHPLRSFLTINSYMAFRIFLALSILSCAGGFTPSNGYGIPSFSHLKIPSVW